MLLLAFGVLVLSALAWRSWRAGLASVLVLLVVEGALRKWFFPEQRDWLYFAKDAVLAATYFSYWRDRSSRTAEPAGRFPAPVLLAAFLVYVTVAVVNPRLPTPLLGLLGFKSHCFYVPVFFLAAEAFASERSVATLGRATLVATVLVVGLGLLQFRSDPGSPINVYVGPSDVPMDVGLFGSSFRARVTGTFSYISGYTAFLAAVAAFALLPLGAVGWRIGRTNLAAGALLALAFIGLLVSGSRGPVMTVLLMVPVHAFLSAPRGAGVASVGVRLLLALAILGVVVGRAAREELETWQERAGGATDTAERLASPFRSTLAAVPFAGPLGVGAGAAHQAASAIAKDRSPESWLGGVTLEDETGRVMLELGVLGFLLTYGLRLALIVWAFGVARQCDSPIARSTAATGAVFLLTSLIGGVVYNATAGILYWLFAALPAAALLIEERAALARERTGIARPSPVPGSPRWHASLRRGTD